MSRKIKKQIAIVVTTVLMLTQLSVLFPMFSLFNMVADAAVLTPTQVASFDDQQWLIDEIIRQVRVSRPTVSSLSQITTEELAGITIINLDSINTNGGTIPSGISLLTSLTNLTVTHSGLTGNVPTTIGSISTLQVLDLHGNELTGSIPTQVGNLTNLTYLNLSENGFSGSIPGSILSANLNKLTYMSLADNNLSGTIPNPTGVMTELLELNLSNNNLSGPLPARFMVGTTAANHAFAKLQNLNLSHNPLNVAFGSMFTNANSTLRYLDLSYCGLTGQSGEYSNNNVLLSLNLSHNSMTAFNGDTIFKNGSTITHLYLNDNPFSSTTFNFGPGGSAKAALVIVDLSNTGITSIGAFPSASQATLKEFYVSR